MTEGTFESSVWHRVSALRPALRPDVTVSRHVYRGRTSFLVRTESGDLVRLTPEAFAFAARLDGAATVDEIWALLLDELGDAAPSQDELVSLLASLHARGVLAVEETPDVHLLLGEARRQRGSALLQRSLTPLSIKLPLWNPSGWLARRRRLVALAFGPVGACLWIGTVLAAAICVLENAAELAASARDAASRPEIYALGAALYVGLKLLHELGHAAAAARFGCRVREVGALLLAFYPVPYVDVSSAGALRSKWKRMLVGAAGMAVELFISALAILCWAAVEPGLLRTACIGIVLVAGASTLLFNGNPLLKYDGYFILSDLIEVPNLASRSTKWWGDVFRRHVLRERPAAPVTPTVREATWLALYAPLAFAYRLALFAYIALTLLAWDLGIGIAVLAASLAGLLVRTAARMSPAGWRPSLRTATAAVLGLILLAGALQVPIPFHIMADGIVWLPDTAYVRAGAPGFIQTARVPGSAVRDGDLLVTSADTLLAGRIRTKQARVEELEIQVGIQQITNRSDAEVARIELGYARDDLRRDLDQNARLEVRSARAGSFSAERPEILHGRYVQEGALIGIVVPDTARTVRALVSQQDAELLAGRVVSAELRLVDRPRAVFATRILRVSPAATQDLPSRALSVAGGGQLATDPRERDGSKAGERLFQVEVELPEGLGITAFGSHALVRLALEPESLLRRATRRARQILLRTVNV